MRPLTQETVTHRPVCVARPWWGYFVLFLLPSSSCGVLCLTLRDLLQNIPESLLSFSRYLLIASCMSGAVLDIQGEGLCSQFRRDEQGRPHCTSDVIG